MPKISSFLWYNNQAKEAAQLYTQVFPESKILSKSTLEDTPSGSVDVVNIEIFGHEIGLMSAGPAFQFTPAISFAISCTSAEEVDQYWNQLIEGGSTLMELAKYDFSERYGWLVDRFGLSWQLSFMGDQSSERSLTPTLMFVGEVCGRSEEAIKFYTSVFPNSTIHFTAPYENGEEPNQPGTLKYASFSLDGQNFAAMDSALNHDFSFSEAISFMVNCRDQEEIDYYWSKLSAVRDAEQCGWLKDKFGVSWQIVPKVMNEMMENGTPEQQARVTQAFLKMKKFNIAELEAAYQG